MKIVIQRLTTLFCTLVVAGSGLSTTGCASGGYKLTRQYAHFVNSKSLILRIILYIFTFVIFGVTLLIDSVYFNTMDFWNGTVSQGTHEFTQGDKKFVAQHEIDPNGLKKSTIRVFSADGQQLQEVVIQQTSTDNIEVHVDQKLVAQVSNIQEFPIATVFDKKGQSVQSTPLLMGIMAQR